MIDISHLVTVGCSYTYCQGLDEPTIQGWPALLSKKLNVPLVNLGLPGVGNDAIYRRVVDYYYASKNCQLNPFFIVAFSGSLRKEEYFTRYQGKKLNNFHTLAIYGEEPMERAIYEQINDNGLYCFEYKKFLHWLSVVNFFKSNQINYFTTNYMIDDSNAFNKVQKNNHSLYTDVYDDSNRLKSFYSLTKTYDKTNCGHDGPLSQQIIADYCHNAIINKYQTINKVTGNYLSLKDYVAVIGQSQHMIPWNFNIWYQKELNNV